MRHAVLLGTVALLALAGTACSGGPVLEPSGSDASAPPSNADTEITVGGDRPVTAHVPANRDLSGAPLLLALHGYSSNASELESYFGLDQGARDRGIVLAYPEGTYDAQHNRFWNATDACCDFDRTGVDDAGYLAGLIDEIAARVAIDPRRVYVAGHSNGGFMSHRMACAHADKVAAIASLAGATFLHPADCDPSEPVAVLQVHGTADDTVRYEGGSLAELGAPGASARYPGAAETVALWAVADGCQPGLVDSTTRLDLDAEIDGPDGPAEATVAESTACDPGGFAELWTIPGAGHVPHLSASFAAELLDFLLAHPKPAR
jgi:polyhydroxybutyrate depolymerase